MSDLSPDELQLAFHEVECRTYDERFGIAYDQRTARDAAAEATALLGDVALGRVADVGCGTGYLGLGLAATGRTDDLHLVDLSPGMLDRARDNADRLGVAATFHEATATDLPFEDHSLDAIVTRGVLHHLHDVDAALTEWRRVVVPGGPVLVLSEPTPHADRLGGAVARTALAGLRAARPVARALGRPLSAHDEQAQQEHRYWDLVAMAANLHTFTPEHLRRIGRDAGFSHVTVRGCGLASIGWAAAYYCLVGELPDLAASDRARRRAARVWSGLRSFDHAVTERVLPDSALLTVQAVFR